MNINQTINRYINKNIVMPISKAKNLDFNNMTQYKHEIGERNSMFIYDWQNILKYYEDKNKSKMLTDKIFNFLALTTFDIKYDQSIHYIEQFGYVFKSDDGSFKDNWNEFVVLGEDLDIAINSMFLYQKYWNAEIGLITFDKELLKELEKQLITLNLTSNNIIAIIDIIKSFGTIAYYYNFIEQKDISNNILTLYNNELNNYLLNNDYKLELNKRYSNNSLPVIIYKNRKHKTKTR